MDEELKKINVIICGRTIPVNVTTEEEVMIRKIEKSINEKLLEFQKSYSQMDEVKGLGMVCLTYAMEAVRKDVDPAFEAEISEKLEGLNQMIEEAIRSF